MDPQSVCLLLKSLYGLKQSSRQWYQRIDQFLLLHGFIRLTSDANIYIQKDNTNGFLILTIYIDDCILVSNNSSLIHDLKCTLQKEFDMSNDDEIHYILGNTILKNQQARWLIINQQNYLISKLQEYNMLNCNPLSTPMASGVCLSKDDCPLTSKDQNQTQSYLYSNIVGSLMYAIINSRPDCAYAVCSLAQYLSNPSNNHIQTLKRTLRYMKGTLSYGIKYKK